MNWKDVQRRLLELGFNPGPIDGVRGPKTDAALVAFKRSIGLRPRPYLGPLTTSALFDEPAPSSSVPWFDAAQAVRGLHEARDRAELVAWFDKSVSWIDPREVPWCGAFVQTCIVKALGRDADTPSRPLGARQWSLFGKSGPTVLGAVMTFWRGSPQGWQGHVGFYAGEDSTHYHVLGGNQRNAVTVTRIAKGRLLESRWPKGWPVTTRPIHLKADGTPVSTNEA